jgi:hypothetical protein
MSGCPSKRDVLFPSSSTFPALEALNYDPGVGGELHLSASFLKQLVTFASPNRFRGHPDSSFPHDLRLSDLARGIDFADVFKMSPHVRFWANPQTIDWNGTLSFRPFTTILESIAPSLLRLSRLYLPDILDPATFSGRHFEPGLAAFLAACASRRITVVFEELDASPGGQRISQNFLEYAKELRRELQAGEQRKAEQDKEEKQA